MPRYITELTQETLTDLLDDVLYSELQDQLEDANCDYIVEVDEDLVPSISFKCNIDSDMDIVVESRPIEDNAGNPGWEFIPTVSCPMIKLTVDSVTQGDAEKKFNQWAAVANLAEALYSIDFYPSYYMD